MWMCKNIYISALFIIAKKKRKQNNLHVTKSKDYHHVLIISDSSKVMDTIAIYILESLILCASPLAADSVSFAGLSLDKRLWSQAICSTTL